MTENLTIEKYMILQKTERVKELLAYGELSLSEIAFQMDYSSVAHLSAQFKKVTGLTPSHFRKIGEKRKGKAYFGGLAAGRYFSTIDFLVHIQYMVDVFR